MGWYNNYELWAKTSTLIYYIGIYQEEMAGIDRISKFSNLIRSLEDCGTRVSIYEEDELIDETFFKNRIKMLRQIEQEVNEDMNREAAL